MLEFINCPACCSKTVQFIKGKVKAVPGYAVKAYWGEEVQLHMLTSALDGGEQPGRWRGCCTPEEEASTVHRIGGWFSFRARSCIKQQFCVFVHFEISKLQVIHYEVFRKIGLKKDDRSGWFRTVCQNVYILQFTQITSYCYKVKSRCMIHNYVWITFIEHIQNRTTCNCSAFVHSWRQQPNLLYRMYSEEGFNKQFCN